MVKKPHYSWIKTQGTSFSTRYPFPFLSLLICLYPFTYSFAEDHFAIDREKGGNLSISVQDTEIAEVFEMLSREGKVNIMLRNGVTGTISINLYDVSLVDAIKTISAAAGYAVEHYMGTYFIVPQTEAGKDTTYGMTTLKTFKVQYTDPTTITTILTKHLSRYGKITALPERNIIVVEELPGFISRIENLLEQLDRQPKQILIEAKILEVTLDDSETFGIDWSTLFRIDKDSTDEGAGRIGVQGLSAPGTPGFFFSFVNPNIQIALDALSAKGRVRTLSTPKLLALEHEEAQVVIGDRTGYRITTTINQVTTESVAFLESGVILRVIPFVDKNGQIMMDIHPEVSTPTLSDGIPSLSTTEVTTQLLANSGQTIFIAGLMRNSSSQQKSGVPVLGNLPVLEKIFSNKRKSIIKTETIVLITPRIIEPGEDPLMTTTASRVQIIEQNLEDKLEYLDALFSSELQK